MSGGGSIGWWVRYAAYAVAGAVSALLAATISRERLLWFTGIPVAAGFALALGAALFAIPAAMRLARAPIGCPTFAVAALAIGVLAYALAGAVVPGMTVTFAGSLVGAALATVAGGAVFSLFDERVPNQERVAKERERARDAAD